MSTAPLRLDGWDSIWIIRAAEIGLVTCTGEIYDGLRVRSTISKGPGLLKRQVRSLELLVSSGLAPIDEVTRFFLPDLIIVGPSIIRIGHLDKIVPSRILRSVRAQARHSCPALVSVPVLWGA